MRLKIFLLNLALISSLESIKQTQLATADLQTLVFLTKNIEEPVLRDWILSSSYFLQ